MSVDAPGQGTSPLRIVSVIVIIADNVIITDNFIGIFTDYVSGIFSDIIVDIIVDIVTNIVFDVAFLTVILTVILMVILIILDSAFSAFALGVVVVLLLPHELRAYRRGGT